VRGAIEWAIARGPRLAVAGAVIASLAAIVASIGAWATTQQQSRDQIRYLEMIADLKQTMADKGVESVAKSDRIAKLTERRLATIAGDDSFCTLHLTERERPGGARMVIQHHGRFPLYEVTMSMAETSAALDAGEAMQLPLGTLSTDSYSIHGRRMQLSGAAKDIFVRFASRNGAWTQVLSLRLVDGRWRLNTVARRKEGSSIKHLYAESEDGFPMTPVEGAPK
jgi:hypothetical protein